MSDDDLPELPTPDDVPDLAAMMEQAKAGVTTRATLLRLYYDGMVAAGFSVDQALAITIAFDARSAG